MPLTTRAFYWQWLTHTFSGPLAWGQGVGFILSIFAALWTMNDPTVLGTWSVLLWIIPATVFVVLFIASFLLAPYWIARDLDRKYGITEAALQQQLADARAVPQATLAFQAAANQAAEDERRERIKSLESLVVKCKRIRNYHDAGAIRRDGVPLLREKVGEMAADDFERLIERLCDPQFHAASNAADAVSNQLRLLDKQLRELIDGCRSGRF